MSSASLTTDNNYSITTDDGYLIVLEIPNKNTTAWTGGSKSTSAWTATAKGTSTWNNESAPQVAYLYDDASKNYDTVSRYYDYLNVVANQSNNNPLTSWN